MELPVSSSGGHVQACFLKLLSLHRAGGLCLYRIEEWWTFELCYKEHVRQFHKEQNQVVSEYSLGTFKEEVNQDEIKVNLARLAPKGSALGAALQRPTPVPVPVTRALLPALCGPAESMSGVIKQVFRQ